MATARQSAPWAGDGSRRARAGGRRHVGLGTPSGRVAIARWAMLSAGADCSMCCGAQQDDRRQYLRDEVARLTSSSTIEPGSVVGVGMYSGRAERPNAGDVVSSRRLLSRQDTMRRSPLRLARLRCAWLILPTLAGLAKPRSPSSPSKGAQRHRPVPFSPTRWPTGEGRPQVACPMPSGRDGPAKWPEPTSKCAVRYWPATPRGNARRTEAIEPASAGTLLEYVGREASDKHRELVVVREVVRSG